MKRGTQDITLYRMDNPLRGYEWVEEVPPSHTTLEQKKKPVKQHELCPSCLKSAKPKVCGGRSSEVHRTQSMWRQRLRNLRNSKYVEAAVEKSIVLKVC
ncbi:hypothetical protein RRG08_017550 [Elysia crispata]|uniref:Uncharacterized protein n=1 Tax=Elysia crispata TaxID=231223 RepID=A0AAE1B8H9_9GAST|nr:hypothetical protein RRG08_017550 [Elysia crispata]